MKNRTASESQPRKATQSHARLCKAMVGALALTIIGCSSNNMADDGLSSGEKQTASRLQELAKSSGGDWEKLSQSDKDYLVNEVAHGSEQTAKMLLRSKAGPMDGGAGGGSGK